MTDQSCVTVAAQSQNVTMFKIYRVAPKLSHKLLSICLLNIGRFSKNFFNVTFCENCVIGQYLAKISFDSTQTPSQIRQAGEGAVIVREFKRDRVGISGAQVQRANVFRE